MAQNVQTAKLGLVQVIRPTALKKKRAKSETSFERAIACKPIVLLYCITLESNHIYFDNKSTRQNSRSADIKSKEEKEIQTLHMRISNIPKAQYEIQVIGLKYLSGNSSPYLMTTPKHHNGNK